MTKDHIVPISKGDPTTVDRIENIVPACKSCNSRKHIGSPPDFQRLLLLPPELEECQEEVYVWRPSDRDEIEELLR